MDTILYFADSIHFLY